MFAKKISKYTYGMQISDTEAKLVEIMNVKAGYPDTAAFDCAG